MVAQKVLVQQYDILTVCLLGLLQIMTLLEISVRKTRYLLLIFSYRGERGGQIEWWLLFVDSYYISFRLFFKLLIFQGRCLAAIVKCLLVPVFCFVEFPFCSHKMNSSPRTIEPLQSLKCSKFSLDNDSYFLPCFRLEFRETPPFFSRWMPWSSTWFASFTQGSPVTPAARRIKSVSKFRLTACIALTSGESANSLRISCSIRLMMMLSFRLFLDFATLFLAELLGGCEDCFSYAVGRAWHLMLFLAASSSPSSELEDR